MRVASQPGRELRQIVDTQFLLDCRDAVDHFLESVLAEQLVFLPFEVLAEGAVFLFRDQRAEGGEQHRVLPRLVRRVHPVELAQQVAQRRRCLRILQRPDRRELNDSIRHLPARLVLSPHAAFYSPEGIDDLRRKTIEVAMDWLKHGKLRNCVNAAMLPAPPAVPFNNA